MPGTVTIGCKLPHGITLDLDTLTPMGEGRDAPVMIVPSEDRVTLNGQNVNRIVGKTVLPDNEPRPGFIGGYGITENVDADFWNAWLERNKNSVFIRKNLIFAVTNLRDAKAKAMEQSDVKSGYEPIDTEKLPDGLKPADSNA